LALIEAFFPNINDENFNNIKILVILDT